jgi:hypothetical protein
MTQGPTVTYCPAASGLFIGAKAGISAGCAVVALALVAILLL